MRVAFVPQSGEFWRSQLLQQGGGPGFAGYSFQRGSGIGGILRGLMRFIMPAARSAGKVIGRQLLKSGASAATDILAGDDPREALIRHGTTGARKLLKKGARKAAKKLQKGKGIGRRPGGARRTINKKRVAKKRPPKKGKKRGKKAKDALGLYLA